MRDRRLPFSAVLLDLDGTLFVDDEALPGAKESVRALRQQGLAIRFTTNTTRISRDSLLAKLRAMGFEISPEELFTAPRAAATTLRARDLRRVLPLVAQDTRHDLEGLDLVDREAQAVLVGDLGSEWSHQLLNRAFQEILGGARLLACQRNRFWRVGGEFVLDAGAYVAALEFAAQVTAEVLGKPSRAFFQPPIDSVRGAALEDALIVGDDLASDIAGAEACGCVSVLVRTGKFRVQDREAGPHKPTWEIESIAELPALIERVSRKADTGGPPRAGR